MPLRPRWAFVFLILTTSLCSADDDHEMEEFLKREYSLSKPYQGNAAGFTGGTAADVSRIKNINLHYYSLI